MNEEIGTLDGELLGRNCLTPDEFGAMCITEDGWIAIGKYTNVVYFNRGTFTFFQCDDESEWVALRCSGSVMFALSGSNRLYKIENSKLEFLWNFEDNMLRTNSTKVQPMTLVDFVIWNWSKNCSTFYALDQANQCIWEVTFPLSQSSIPENPIRLGEMPLQTEGLAFDGKLFYVSDSANCRILMGDLANGKWNYWQLPRDIYPEKLIFSSSVGLVFTSTTRAPEPRAVADNGNICEVSTIPNGEHYSFDDLCECVMQEI